MNKKKLLALLMALVMTLTLVPVTALAEDEVIVRSNEEFYDAMNASSTTRVTLDVDVTIAAGDGSGHGPIERSGDVTLDLNGHKITVKDTFAVTNGTMIVTGDGTIANMTSSSATKAVVLRESGSMTLENGTITGYSIGISFENNSCTGTLTVNGGSISGPTGISFYGTGNVIVNGGTITGTSSNGIGISNNGTGTVTVNAGASLTGTKSAIVNSNGGVVLVNGGSIQVTDDFGMGSGATVNNTNGTVTINGGTIRYNTPYPVPATAGAVSNNLTTANGTTTITSGTFYGKLYNKPTGTLAISGGTFDHDPTTYVVEGYKAVNNGDGTWTVKAKDYVAQIGTTKYETLEDALAAAESGATVNLIADIDYSTTYTTRNARDEGNGHAVDLKDVTLDMGNHTIKSINATVTFGGNGATIKNGTFDLVEKNTDGSYKDGSYALIIDNYVNAYGVNGTVNLENLTIDGGLNVKKATVNVTNCTAHTTTTLYHAIWTEDDAVVTIYSGSYINTKDGTINGEAKGDVISTGTSTAEGFKHEAGSKLYIRGGSFYDATDNNKLVGGSEQGSIIISGGYFNTSPATALIADGYKVDDNTDEGTMATYHYKVVSDGNVAKNITKDIKYTTLKDAVEAASSGDTIKLLQDIDLANDPLTVEGYAEVAPAGKTITLNLNDHAISDGGLAVSGKLTITGNGTITGVNRGINVNAGGELNVTGGTITNTGTSYAVRAEGTDTSGVTVNISGGKVTNGTEGLGAVYVKNGSLTISGGTVSNSRYGQRAVWVRYCTVNISGGDVSNSGEKAKAVYVSDGTLTISGGTVSNSGNGATAVVGNNSKLTISNGTVTNTGAVTTSDAHAVFVTGGTLTISNGEVTSTGGNTTEGEPGTDAVMVTGDAVATISGGTVTGYDYGVSVLSIAKLTVSGNANIGATTGFSSYAICTNGSEGQNATVTINGGTIIGKNLGVYLPSGTLTVTGGTITGATGVYVKSGKVTVTGGAFNGVGDGHEYNYSGNGASPTDDAFVFESCDYPGGETTATISGGEFKSTNAKAIACYASDEGHTPLSGFITGGLYTGVDKAEAPDSSYIAPGYKAVALGGEQEGWWQVGKVVPTASTTGDPSIDNEVTYTVGTVIKDGDEVIPNSATTGREVTIKGTTDDPNGSNRYDTISVNDPTSKKAVGAAELSSLKSEKVAEIVAAAVESAGTQAADVTAINVVLVSDNGTEVVNNTITYEVHPEAIVYKNEDAIGSYAIQNEELGDTTFTFKLAVPGTLAGVGDKVTVVHRHNDTSENMGTFEVDDERNITLTVGSFSDFDISAATVDNGTHFAFKGIGLRRRVLTSDHTTVVSNATDIRFGYGLINYNSSNTYYFQWKKEGGDWSSPIKITNFNAGHTEAALVVNKVPGVSFGTKIYTRIFMVDSNGDTYILDGTGMSVNDAITTIIGNPGTYGEKWADYAAYLKGDLNTYSISDYID